MVGLNKFIIGHWFKKLTMDANLVEIGSMLSVTWMAMGKITQQHSKDREYLIPLFW